MNKRILVIYAGGTIGMVDQGSGYQPTSADMFEPVLRQKLNEANFTKDFDFLGTPRTMDSTKASHTDWNAFGEIIEKNMDAYDGFVLLTGTDTIDFCAAGLSFGFSGLQKPIVITGSMLPLSKARSDGLTNFMTAYASAQAGDIAGVSVAFGRRVFSGVHIVKKSLDFDGISSPHFDPLMSEDSLGHHFDAKAIAHLRQDFDRSAACHFGASSHHDIPILNAVPGGADDMARMIEICEDRPAIMMMGFGNGNLPDSPYLQSAMRKAASNGQILTVGTQVIGGISDSQYGAGSWVEDCGAIKTGSMTQAVTLIKLDYLLRRSNSKDTVRTQMLKNHRGEMLRWPNYSLAA